MVARSSIKHISPAQLALDSLPRRTKKAFLAFTKFSFLHSEWYLAGGTALAIQDGHRQSVDLDFFSEKKTFREITLERNLQATGAWKTTYREKGTIYGTFTGAKMSFMAYPFFRPSGARLRCGTINILLPHDIAAMKILAISQRGKKRDFIDIYWYCRKHESLDKILRRVIKQYPGQEHNLPHILKSLTYFDDAEEDPMPKIFFDVTWKGVKKFFRDEVRKITLKLLS